MGRSSRSRILAAALLISCGCGKTAPLPDAIRPQEDSCASCRMQVSQPRFAAEILSGEGQYLKFDDLGCLKSYLQANPRSRSVPTWVMDFEAGRWIEARSAFFARGTAEKTPMGSGILAFASRDRARAKGPAVLSFEEVIK